MNATRMTQGGTAAGASLAIACSITEKLVEGQQKSGSMCAVTPWMRRAVWLLVIYGILHLLISPLPELGATLSGKSPIFSCAFITFALLELLIQLLAISGSLSDPGVFPEASLLDKICLRLC